METKDLLKKVRKIEIKTRKLSSHLFSGHYHSSFKGRGMTFSEVRPYQYGDDVKAIDWNVTAKYNDTYVKVFEEERELTLFLLVDISASQFFGTSTTSKREILAEIAATLAFSAIQNNDKIGLLLFTNQIELVIPPKKGKSHVLRIIRELVEFKPQNKETNVNVAFDYVTQVMKRKSIVFVLSDFISPNFSKTLQMAAKKHDITGISVYDNREKILPDVGLIEVMNAETNVVSWLDTSNKAVQIAYQDTFVEQQKSNQLAFVSSNAGFIQMETKESYVSKLLVYFKSRS